jgi:hypothetical protein
VTVDTDAVRRRMTEYADMQEQRQAEAGLATRLIAMDLTAALREVDRLRDELSDLADGARTLKEQLLASGAEVDTLHAQVSAARAYADQMGGYCSPHGISARYADELRAAIDNAKEAS